MKYNYRLFYLFLIILFLHTSCERPTIGYLSDNIKTPEDTIKAQKGVYFTAGLPIVDGSTYPLSYSVVSVKDGKGNPTDELFTKHKIVLWTSPFNPKTDTTLALAKLKLVEKDVPAVLMNENCGQLTITPVSRLLTENDFVIDMKVGNQWGERVFNNFAKIHFSPFQPFEFPTSTRFAIQLAKAATPNSFVLVKPIEFYEGSGSDAQVRQGTNSDFKITKISNVGEPGINVIMKILDKNGKPITTKHGELSGYPSGSSYMANYHFNSVQTTETDEGSIFSLPAVPFPQYGTYTGSALYLQYYTIGRNAIDLDWEALGEKPENWGNYRAYIRFGIKINEPGTWEIVFKSRYFIRKRT